MDALTNFDAELLESHEACQRAEANRRQADAEVTANPTPENIRRQAQAVREVAQEHARRQELIEARRQKQ